MVSLQHPPRWLPIASWLFLFVWIAGYGVAKLALESTAPLNLLALRFIGAISQVTSIMFLVPGIAALIAWLVVDEVMPMLAWPGIGLAAVGVLLVLYAPPSAVSVKEVSS